MSRLRFQIQARATHSKARATQFTTLHNDVTTPLFMPVGTFGSVRTQTNEDLENLGAQILLANTYHLLLRPGIEVFKHVGGLHRFMNWKKSLLTDSGGFQIFSLPHSRSIKEEGAKFKSYINGDEYLLTPELSIQMQKAIGSDIMMVLDQCIDSTSSRKITEKAMHLTHRWARRSLVERGDSPQSLFAIVQGACFEDLRKQSVESLCSISDFDGFAIGGLAVGETKSQREDLTELTTPLLPQDRPIYLMGVGMPIDLLEAVHRGVDLFDCIIPLSLALQGVVFTSHGKIDLKRGIHKFSDRALDSRCDCSACSKYSRAYLHHLVKSKEALAGQLLSTHNLKFYFNLMNEMRTHILADTFYDYYKVKRLDLVRVDEDNPPLGRIKRLTDSTDRVIL